jgi:hypothetical protein
MRRGHLVWVAALAAAACSPDIGKGTYFCGPERFCPPDMECDDLSYTCDSPRLADRFSCPSGSSALEPDDSAGAAHDDGAVTCGATLVTDRIGCMEAAGDEDFLAFEVTGDCVGESPHIEVTLRFPIAFVPLALDLLDEEGDTVAPGQPCTASGDRTGTDRVCVDRALGPGRYFLRVRAEPDGPDCDGDCHYNEYTIIVAYPLA